jgi:biopolymer transport protein ExbD
MRYSRKRSSQEESVDIGPLIDMVFILLIFFAVSTTFVKDMQLELDRPSASSSQRASTKAIRVYIDRGGNTYVDEQPVKSWMLQSRIRDLLAVSSSKKVLVITDCLIPAEKLIDVVDQCKLGGAAEVGVATEVAVQ